MEQSELTMNTVLTRFESLVIYKRAAYQIEQSSDSIPQEIQLLRKCEFRKLLRLVHMIWDFFKNGLLFCDVPDYVDFVQPFVFLLLAACICTGDFGTRFSPILSQPMQMRSPNKTTKNEMDKSIQLVFMFCSLFAETATKIMI